MMSAITNCSSSMRQAVPNRAVGSIPLRTAAATKKLMGTERTPKKTAVSGVALTTKFTTSDTGRLASQVTNTMPQARPKPGSGTPTVCNGGDPYVVGAAKGFALSAPPGTLGE